MPPAPGQKGTGKKGAGAIRQRSRNTTPMSGPINPPASTSSASIHVEPIETEFLELKLESVRNLSYDDLVEPSPSNAVIPDSKNLDGLITKLTKLHEIIERRGQWCDKGMRLVAMQRKNHVDDMAAEDRGDRAEEGAKKANKKKRKANDSLAAPKDTNTGALLYLVRFHVHLTFISTSTSTSTSISISGSCSCCSGAGHDML